MATTGQRVRPSTPAASCPAPAVRRRRTSSPAATCATSTVRRPRVGSAFRGDVGERYGVRLLDGAFTGLLARAVVVIDADGTVLHGELVRDIGQEPDYDAVLAAPEGSP